MSFLEPRPHDEWVWAIWKAAFALYIVWYLTASVYVVVR